MYLTIFLVIVLLSGLGVLSFLFYKKWSQLKIMNPDSVKGSKIKQLKNEILRGRIERASGKHLQTIQKQVLVPFGKKIQTGFRVIAGKLTAAERRYEEKIRKTAKVDLASLEMLIEQGKEAMDKGEWDKAEKALIQVISADAKHALAYELLGRMYLHKKEFDLAKQTFQFLNKLTPSDASVLTSLGEVEERRGDWARAQKFYKKAVDLSPKNPKYLDLYIKATIEMGDVHEARSAVDKLKEANPDNKKIEVFEKLIENKSG